MARFKLLTGVTFCVRFDYSSYFFKELLYILV
jgi:hypothetical protein